MLTNIPGISIIILIVIILVLLFYWLFVWRRHRSYHFVSDRIVFQIAHPTSATPDDIRAAIQSFLRTGRNDSQRVDVKDGSRVDQNWRNRLQPPTSIITFPSQTAETFSLVPIQLAGHWKIDLRPNDVIKALRGAYAEIQNGSLDMGNGISLQSISPDWFAKNLHHGGTTGGPGSWPINASAPGAIAPNAYQFRLAGPMLSLQPYKAKISGSNVHVAILDTVPTAELERSAQRLAPAPAAARAGSSLIQYLFTPSNLDIHPYSNPGELTSLEVYTPAPQHYKMPDHGTYVAGIIHTIAPNAPLHLYEVLNSFGLGTLTSMAQGLSDAVNDHLQRGNTSLIINCSFMLDLITRDGRSNLDQELDLANPARAGLPAESIRGVLAWATGLNNVVIVAAAGNGAGSSGRPAASYPAAFSGVVGVGALPAGNPTYSTGTYMPASYSNLSFDPQNKLAGEGFMTFGGEIDLPQPRDTVPISTQGVLGVYVGKLLRNASSANVNNLQLTPSEGWARWAGTSFAAPIITGLLAAQPGDASVSGAPTPPAVSPLTAEGENVILVQQG